MILLSFVWIYNIGEINFLVLIFMLIDVLQNSDRNALKITIDILKSYYYKYFTLMAQIDIVSWRTRLS